MKAWLSELFRASVEAVAAQRCVPAALPSPPRGRTVVVGAGKASAAMARVIEAQWPTPLTGLVITRDGHLPPPEPGVSYHLEYVEARHPVPDERGVEAAGKIMEHVRGLSDHDLVLVLLSGGGSSLMTLPAAGISLADKQQVTRQLLRSGATIAEMNCVRKHLSAIKGGRLALAAWPARVETLLISDVPGDDPALIASGPTLPDRTHIDDAKAILERYHIDLPPSVASHLERAVDESPKALDPRLSRSTAHLIARPRDALEAAAEFARAAGWQVLVIGDDIQGEARDVARDHAEVIQHILRHQEPIAPPCILLSGGEASVTVRGKGRGGRCSEFLLALADQLGEDQPLWALAADTDGIDGTEDNAGAFLTPNTLARARALGLEPRKALIDSDGWGFFSALGDLFMTGPTFTNVNELRAIVLPGKG